MICPSCHITLKFVPVLPFRCRCGAVASSPEDWTLATKPWTEGGPGTELIKLFASLGIQSKIGCDCGVIAAEMDRLGPDGCRKYRSCLLAKIEKNSTLYSIWEKAKAGLLALGKVPLSLPGMFDLAISRAETLTDPSPRL